MESGPAAGALATAEFGRHLGERRLLAFDMGGTTAKAALIKDGEPLRNQSFEVCRVYRFKRGSGLPISVPVIELNKREIDLVYLTRENPHHHSP